MSKNCRTKKIPLNHQKQYFLVVSLVGNNSGAFHVCSIFFLQIGVCGEGGRKKCQNSAVSCCSAQLPNGYQESYAITCEFQNAHFYFYLQARRKGAVWFCATSKWEIVSDSHKMTNFTSLFMGFQST